MQMDIWYISALCGSGKTHHLINRAYELAKSGHRVLVLQPTIELIERTIELELLTKPNHPKYKVFHRKKSGGSVASAISKHSKAGDELDGTIVFATQQVLPYIRYFAESSRWHVLMDEEMQVHACNQYVVPDTHSLLTDHLQLEPHKDVYSKITASDLEAIEDIARNKRKDQVLEQFRSAAQILRNDNYESYVNTKQYGELLVGPHKTLTIHSVLNPSVLAGFGSVTMASALFEDSMIYKLWSKMGVNFIEDAALTDDLLFTEHEKGSLVTIFYAEESTWSRNRRKSRIEDSETTILDEFVRAVAAKYEGREFLFQANRDVKDTIFGDNAKRIPNVPHGLNIFSHVHNIAFLSSLNPPPEHFRFMERCWEISGDELKRAVYCSTVYQAVMRGSIRDPNNEDDKIAIVPDRFVADYLHGVFPGSHVFRLDTDIPILIRGTPGRPRRFASVNERVAHHRREQARKELMDGILALDVPDLSQGMVEIDGNLCNENGIDAHTHFVTNLSSATIYGGKQQTTNPLYLNFGDVDQFIDVLREMHERELQHKEKNNYLICPAIFNPNGKKTKDIEFLRHLWIDVEHGELPPERWRSLFPGIRIVVMSTFSHEVASPRYRVFIPTSRRLTVESYRYLWDHIEATLKEAGFWSDVEDRPPGSQLSGLDRSSRSPHQLYYAPCRRAGSTDAFFMDYPGDILDPLDWIREDRVPSPQMHALPILDAPMTGGISMSGASEADAAIQRWRAAPVGHGSREFFMLGMSVFRTHGNIPEVEATLDQEVLFARSPEERRRQIPSIIDWLTARRRAA